MASEIHPLLNARAQFIAFDVIVPQAAGAKTKVKIDFAVDSINKNGHKKTRIPMELASAVGAALSVKVEPERFETIKHLLKPDVDLSLTICPLHWKIENGSGMLFDLIEIEKFDAILEPV